MALTYEYPSFNISRDRFINDDDGTQTFNELQILVERIKDFHRECVARLVHGENFTLNVSVNTGSIVTPGDSPVILCDASVNSISVNLPAASENINVVYYIKKIDSSGNSVTIDGNSNETIDGSLTQVISVQYDSLTLVSDGSNWHII